MTEHEKNLRMIEEVDPSDTAKLDEIDVRVWCWLNKYTLENFDTEYAEFTVKEREGYFSYEVDPCQDWVSYTRSRDALKAIRPEGWFWYASTYDKIRSFALHKGIINSETKEFEPHFLGKLYSTEELAELHAIIQAIAYEGNQK